MNKKDIGFEVELNKTEDLVSSLQQIIESYNTNEKKDKSLTNSDKAKLLTTLRDLYEEKNDFEVGSLIKWKKQLKNRKKPEYDEPAIILEILETPICDPQQEAGSTYFNEMLDIKVGVYHNDALLIFYFDSKRFQKYGS